MRKLCASAFFLFMLIPAIALALPKGAEDELQNYIAAFQGNDIQQQKIIAQSLEWSGFSQPKLFDLIEDKLLSAYSTANDKQRVDFLSWLSKALAFSGNTKYQSTLRTVAQGAHHKKLRKHAEKSLETLQHYRSWNKHIIDEANWNPRLSTDMNRLRSMIQSDILELKRLAAKRVHYKHIYDEPLLDLFEQELLANYRTNSNDKVFIDSWAWVCKAMAGSRNLKYQATVVKVANGAGNKRLRKYAAKYLKYYKS